MLDQTRAKYAWDCAKAAQEKGQEFLERYAGLVKKLPALISTNGLGQTLAFLAAKAKVKEIKEKGSSRRVIDRDKEEGLLYHHLEGWLTRDHDPRGPYAQQAPGEPVGEPAKLLYRIACGDSTTYPRATAEALALINWLKSFADALQEKKEGGAP